MTPSLLAATEPAVVAIGVAQEFQSTVFATSGRGDDTGPPSFTFYKADRRVSPYYLCVSDADFGTQASATSVATSLPGQGLGQRPRVGGAPDPPSPCGLPFLRALSDWFASWSDPTCLQRICDRLGSNQIHSFLRVLNGVIPTPLGAPDRLAGFWQELSTHPVEVCRTIVFDAPPSARIFFESGDDSLDRVVTRGTEVTVNALYKHSRSSST